MEFLKVTVGRYLSLKHTLSIKYIIMCTRTPGTHTTLFPFSPDLDQTSSSAVSLRDRLALTSGAQETHRLSMRAEEVSQVGTQPV